MIKADVTENIVKIKKLDIIYFFLQVLDLSFNNITGESILNLGLLARLKVLHLTGNQLQMLPLNMAGPSTCPGEK